VAHITSSHTNNHVLKFMQEDIPPATTDLNDHNALTNLWSQKMFTEEELSTLFDSSLDIDIEPQYDALTQRLNAINRKSFDVYRLLTLLVHANNSHKHPARTLITDTSEARDTGSTTIRTLMGELEKQAARKAARATRESKGAQPKNRTQTTSESPPKIETIPHTFSVGAWLLDATKDNTRARKTACKTTSSSLLSQTTIDEFYREKDGNDDEETKSKRLKDDTHTVDTHAFTTSSRAKDDHLAETINLIDETFAMCRDDIPGSITMIVDSGASHILLRHEHAHVLHNVICDNSKSYATIKCAKQGVVLTAIGTGSLNIGRFCLQAFICRDNELQHSLLGLNPLTARGCTAQFTNIQAKSHGLPPTYPSGIQISPSNVMARDNTAGASRDHYNTTSCCRRSISRALP
jgi:hypothetical protein